jgi:hypothetical protein
VTAPQPEPKKCRALEDETFAVGRNAEPVEEPLDGER